MKEESLISLDDIKNYYSNSIKSYGASAKGVDWNGEEGQILRYKQLLKIIQDQNNFSLLDYGCGYGAIINILRDLGKEFKYFGLDISEAMIEAAKDLHGKDEDINFIQTESINFCCDFVIASGVFNVKLNSSSASWERYIENTLDSFDVNSNSGFAFNCLSNYSDKSFQEDKLFYADPKVLFDLCKNKYSQDVALLHDYGLYEFTILVHR